MDFNDLIKIKFKFKLLIFCLILLYSCNQKQILKTGKENIKVDSAINSIIKKYHLYIESIDINKEFPIIKTIDFPREDYQVEFRRYHNDHFRIELMVFKDSSFVSIIPFYDKSYFEQHIKSESFIQPFASELNKTFFALKTSQKYKNHKKQIYFENSPFSYNHSFINFIMKEMLIIHFEEIMNISRFNDYKKYMDKISLKKLSKFEQYLIRINYFADHIEEKNSADSLIRFDREINTLLYGFGFKEQNLLLKFEFNLYGKNDTFKVDVLNYDKHYWGNF